MAALAKTYKAWILVGSIGIKAADGRIFNRSYMLAPDGAIAARYDKIHMFDVDLGDGHTYRESATIMPGSEAVLSPSVGGPVGLSICYDLRFAALYRTLAKAGAQMLCGASGLHPHHRRGALAYSQPCPRHRERRLCDRTLPIWHARRQAPNATATL
jgi:predicted amidohydrolase